MDLKDINNHLELSESNINITLNSILASTEINDSINVSESIYNDTTIDLWINKLPITRGGSIIMDKIIKNPINNKELLIKRQNITYEIYNYQLEILKENEKDILWIMNLKKEIDEDSSINLLFPSTYLINRLNNYRIFLDGYHLYKILFIPCSCFIYPLSIFLTPYYYLNKYMHLNLSFAKYLEILFQFLKMLLKPSGNLRKDFFKIVSFLIYIFIYIYSIYQTFIISYISYKVREKLLFKIKGLVDFIKTSLILVKRSNFIWKPFDIYNLNEIDVNYAYNKLSNLKYDISTVYKLWKDDDYKKAIFIILKVVYILDVINVVSKLKRSNYWCIPKYSNKTSIIGISNPLLDNKQVLNPVNLNKNIIITGVNAGGKTTFVKSIASNIILAQTIGIINALKAEVILYDAIISFMRVKDEVGQKSYFEAETDCCNKMIIIANNLFKEKKKGLFILDEPMHSTPPIEGMSVAYAIAKYLGKLEGITTIITTHFHNLISLGDTDNNFINLSVNAYKDDKNKDNYLFDYKINRGASKQTIAIELLKRQKFNDEIINSAIEIKNKLCNQNLRYDL